MTSNNFTQTAVALDERRRVFVRDPSGPARRGRGEVAALSDGDPVTRRPGDVLVVWSGTGEAVTYTSPRFERFELVIR
jgi:hypothetical protein